MSRSPKAKLRRKGLSKIGISAPPKRALLSRLVDYFWERGWLLWTHQDNDQHRWSLRVQGEHTETHTFETLIELWRWWAQRVTWAFVAEASVEDALALYHSDDALSLAIRHWAMTSGDSCLMRDADIVDAYKSFFLHIQGDLKLDWRAHESRLAASCSAHHDTLFFELLQRRIINHERTSLERVTVERLGPQRTPPRL